MGFDGLLDRADYSSSYNEHTWDGSGNRVGLGFNGTSSYSFVYDPTAGIPAVIEEVTPDGSVYYYREPSGSLIARRVGITGDNWRYYHFDELGSTRALTDEFGYQSDSYTYDAWGNLTANLGSTPQPYQYVGRLGYYTHYQDVDLYGHPKFKLLQLGVRFYDPEIGRFTQRDPLPTEESPYVYAGGNPARFADPTGEDWLGDHAIDDGELIIDPSCYNNKVYDGMRKGGKIGTVKDLLRLLDCTLRKHTSSTHLLPGLPA